MDHPRTGYVGFRASYRLHGLIDWLFNVAMAPNADAEVGQRLVSEEPMYLIVNLGLSENFGAIEWVFPSVFTALADIVRVAMTDWRVSGRSRRALPFGTLIRADPWTEWRWTTSACIVGHRNANGGAR